MQRKTASDFDPAVMKLFDQYVHGIIDRRGFLNGATRYAVGGVTAAMLLESLSPRFAQAQVIARDDLRIVTKMVEVPSPAGNGKIRGLLAMPANLRGKLPAVLVVHENRGLNPHIEDIARRLAVENLIAFAPDALTPLGGYPGDEDKARDNFAKLDRVKMDNDFIASTNYLKSLPESNGKFGATGFCFGGAVVNMLATRFPDLGAAVPFYGGQPAAEEAVKIKSPMLLHYAGNDSRINSGWPAFEVSLKAAGVRYAAHIYPKVEHGFHNDSTPRYDEPAARLAWTRTLDFFRSNLA